MTMRPDTRALGMRRTGARRSRVCATLALVGSVCAVPVAFPQAFVLSGESWTRAAGEVYVDFSITNPPADPPNSVGPDTEAFSAAYVEAMDAWNERTGFRWFANESGAEVDPCSGQLSGAVFAQGPCGGAFGGSTLAVQISTISVPGERIERTLTVFNNNVSWNVYSGAGAPGFDFRRVAVHELGHGLGLDHSANGSIMFATTNATEVPQAGDVAGVTAIYGAGAAGDVDGDGFANPLDNCPVTANSAQLDGDGDGYGDPCDLDAEGDGFVDDLDNCPLTVNSDQSDIDGDGVGDVCDGDADADGRFDGETLDTRHGVDPLGFRFFSAGPDSVNASFFYLAQTFTPTITGMLTRVALPIRCPAGTVDLEIRDVTGSGAPGVPSFGVTSFVAGSGIVPVSGRSLTPMSLATPVPVTSGVPIAVSVRTSAECDLLLADSAYAGGEGYLGTAGAFFFPVSGDFAFETYVEPEDTDNCPRVPNPDQADTDGDGIGDACEGAEGLPAAQVPAVPAVAVLIGALAVLIVGLRSSMPGTVRVRR